MRTTVLGLLAATASTIQTSVQAGHSLTDWKSWILPVLLALLGYSAKDSDKGK